jgi:hypothetical protein
MVLLQADADCEVMLVEHRHSLLAPLFASTPMSKKGPVDAPQQRKQ